MQKQQSEFFGFSEADIWSDLTETLGEVLHLFSLDESKLPIWAT